MMQPARSMTRPRHASHSTGRRPPAGSVLIHYSLLYVVNYNKFNVSKKTKANSNNNRNERVSDYASTTP